MKMNRQQIQNYIEKKLRNEEIILLNTINAYGKIPDSRKDSREKLIAECEKRLFNVYVVLGKLKEASVIAEKHGDTESLKTIQELQNGIDRPDTEVCSCVPDTTTGIRGFITLPNYVNWKRIKHPLGYWVNVYKCVKCGFVNVTNVYEPLRKLDNIRANYQYRNDYDGLPDTEVFK